MAFTFASDFRRRLAALGPRLLRGRRGDEGALGGRVPGRSEFREHRPYVEPDDLRDLDWHVFMRHGLLVTKTYESRAAGEVCVVLDRSSSMGPEGGDKDRIAREVAAGLGALALQGGAVFEVRTLAQGGPVTLGRFRSERRLEQVLSLLENLGPPSGPTWLSRLVHFPPAPPEGRVPFLITDFFCEPWPAAGIAALTRGALGGGIILALTHEERHPQLRGSKVLRDVETGQAWAIPSESAFLEALEREASQHEEQVRRTASASGLRFAILDGERPFESVLGDLWGSRL